MEFLLVTKTVNVETVSFQDNYNSTNNFLTTFALPHVTHVCAEMGLKIIPRSVEEEEEDRGKWK